jgi:hypothetical protein
MRLVVTFLRSCLWPINYEFWAFGEATGNPGFSERWQPPRTGLANRIAFQKVTLRLARNCCTAESASKKLLLDDIYCFGLRAVRFHNSMGSGTQKAVRNTTCGRQWADGTLAALEAPTRRLNTCMRCSHSHTVCNPTCALSQGASGTVTTRKLFVLSSRKQSVNGDWNICILK